MVDETLPQITETTSFSNADEFLVNQGGNPRRISGENVAEGMEFPSGSRVYSVYQKEQDTVANEAYNELFAFIDTDDITATNLTDAGTPTWTASKVASGLQIVLSTSSRNIAFSTENKIGSAGKTRIRWKGVISTGTTGAAGIGIFDGTDFTRLYFQGNIGRLTLLNSGGGGGILKDGIGPLNATLTVEMELITNAIDQTAVLYLSLDGEAPFSFAINNIAIGDIELIQRNAQTCTHSMVIEALGAYGLDTINIGADPEISETNRNAINAANGFFETLRRNTPVGWTYSIPNGYEFYQSAGSYFSSIDLRPPLAESDPEVLVLHVDVATGSDSNPGTAASPLKSLNVAASRIGSDGRTIIKAKGGLYPYANCYRGAITGAIVQLVSWDGNTVISSMHDDTLSFSLDTGTTYVATLSAGDVSTVFDADDLTADGDYGALELAADLATCRATASTYFVSGSDVYVNLHDGRAPDTDLRVYVKEVGGASDIYGVRQTIDGQVLYMENLHIEGGEEPFSTRTAVNTQTITTYAKNCTVKYGLQNGVNQNSAGLQVWQNCVAAWNGDDGFNWKSSPFGGAGPLAIEINCTGRWNGRDSEGTNNGSTMHSGGSVIRVNGTYDDNQDRNVHDIDDSFSWNFNCTANDSQNDEAGFACGTSGSSTDGTLMWLDGCSSSGNTTDIECNSSAATVYTSNFTGGGANSGSGTITTYTP